MPSYVINILHKGHHYKKTSQLMLNTYNTYNSKYYLRKQKKLRMCIFYKTKKSIG